MTSIFLKFSALICEGKNFILNFFSKKAKVKYRKNVTFKGITINSKNKKIKDEAVHFARDEKNFPRIIIDREKVGKLLEKKKNF